MHRKSEPWVTRLLGFTLRRQFDVDKSYFYFSRTFNESNGVIFALSCLMASHAALASDSSAIATIRDVFKHNHAIVQLGGFTPTQGVNQHININTLIGNQYTVNSKSSWNGLVGLGYLHDGPENNWFTLAYGLNAFYLAKTSVRGAIIQENLFDNLNYSYNATYYPLYALAKATVNNMDSRYAVTFDLGIGPDFIRVDQYKEQPLADFVLSDHAFASKTSTTFAAIAGVGLKLNNVFGTAPLECGYRFFYLGQGQLNINNSQYIDSLKTGYNYASALMCAITV